MSLYPPPDDPVLKASDLTGDPEVFLPDTFQPSPDPLVWKGVMGPPIGTQPLTGLAKGVSQVVRGASLGLLGDPEPPATWPQTLAEIGGSILPGAALSAVTGPAVAATPVLRTFPIIAQRAIAEGAAGALTGAAHAGFTGGNVPAETAFGAAAGAAAGIGWHLWSSRARGLSAPEQIKEAIESRALSEGPPGPPGLGQGTRGEQVVPAYPGAPIPGRASARVLSNEVIPTEPGRPPGGPPGLARRPLALTGPEPTPGPIQEGPIFPRPLSPLEGPRGSNPVEQLYLPDMGATQLRLPMDIVPNGRMNRYATPTRYKGTYETPELAVSESNVIAQAAAREGARTIRVTTTIQPREGPPIGGSIRVYQGQPDGTATLVSEKVINMGAVKAAQVSAAPMRRMIPDYFEVVYNPKLDNDILIPVSPEVEKGLRISLAIDPHQSSFPMSPEQLSFLNSIEGRTIRQKIDLGASLPKLDEVMRQSEEVLRRAFLDVPEAPPAMAGAVIRPTEEAVRARELLANLEVADTDLNQFLGTLKGLRPKDRFNRTLAWLQSKCGGGV